MRFHAIIYFLLIVLLMGCRSSKQSDKAYHDLSKSTETKATSQTDSTRTDKRRSERITADVFEIRDIRTVTFDSLGRIQSIQDERRQTGSRQLVESQGSETALSVTDKTEKVIKNTDNDIAQVESSISKVDSRPVQGWEIVGIVAVLVLILLSVLMYIKKKIKR